MVYESQISFTLDTICPWTYLAKKRLDEALHQFRSTPSASMVTFTTKFLPYQLYPSASQVGESKYDWYKKTKYDNSEERMKMYTALMSAYGAPLDIDFRFDGLVANTLQAHRVVQHYQEARGAEVADKIVNSLYEQYFEQAQHPSSSETLLTATTAAGIDEAEARQFIEAEDEGLQDVKLLVREQAGNGVDSVPYIVFEGRRRDFTLEGAKEIPEYLKVLQQVAKESS